MLLSGHRQAQVYQQALFFTKEMYRLTALFPDEERVVLHYALRRLAVNLCQNVAAALVAKGKKQRRLCSRCLEECIALDAQLEIAREVGFVSAGDVGEAFTSLHAIHAFISGMIGAK